MALTNAQKTLIQTAYTAWLASRGFRARRGQREMIAEVARLFSGDGARIGAIEAGTGTGKTAAYCLPAIPIAQALGKSVVISTATVALQEQIMHKDLPDLRDHAELTFDFALAKGRGRYVCLKRLDDRLRYAGDRTAPMFAELAVESLAVHERMLDAFSRREWDGELDSWSEGIGDDAWRAVTTDHRGCTNNRCGFFRQCPFFKARGRLDKADVIVANHDLVLADLALGGGVVLPAPEETIYVLDEAHHLPDKTQQHFTVRARVRGTLNWLEQVNTLLGGLCQRFARPGELLAPTQRVVGLTEQLAARLSDVGELLKTLDYRGRDDERLVCRFPLGAVPDALAALAGDLLEPSGALFDDLATVHTLLEQVIDGERSFSNGFEAEDWLPVVGREVSRAAGLRALVEDYAAPAAAPADIDGIHARWVTRIAFDVGEDFELASAPLSPGALLASSLWSRCHAALCTSATLTALGRFDRFLARAGIDEPAVARRIDSPFDFPRIAVFAVPAMQTDPRDGEAHHEEVATLLPDLLALAGSALVLFTSWRQQREVLGRLGDTIRDRMKVQGSRSKQALIDAHRADVDAGEPSYLVGLASFAEGLDLPDDYCRHVIIGKLPFAVPDDPLDEALAEWTEAQGRNPFMEIAVPDAALRLVQACGRLIRHEGDHGRITLLDRRILTQRYGASLLGSLPAYRRELSS